MRCITSDGRNVNVAEEMNRINQLKKEKNENNTIDCSSSYTVELHSAGASCVRRGGENGVDESGDVG